MFCFRFSFFVKSVSKPNWSKSSFVIKFFSILHFKYICDKTMQLLLLLWLSLRHLMYDCTVSLHNPSRSNGKLPFSGGVGGIDFILVAPKDILSQLYLYRFATSTVVTLTVKTKKAEVTSYQTIRKKKKNIDCANTFKNNIID